MCHAALLQMYKQELYSKRTPWKQSNPTHSTVQAGKPVLFAPRSTLRAARQKRNVDPVSNTTYFVANLDVSLTGPRS